MPDYNIVALVQKKGLSRMDFRINRLGFIFLTVSNCCNLNLSIFEICILWRSKPIDVEKPVDELWLGYSGKLEPDPFYGEYKSKQ